MTEETPAQRQAGKQAARATIRRAAARGNPVAKKMVKQVDRDEAKESKGKGGS